MSDDHIEYVTARVDGQLFGLPILRVRDVFVPERITRVPLAEREITGLLNLRGRIVTILGMRQVLGFDAPRLVDPDADAASPMAIGVEHGGESYGLLVDSIGEVLRLEAAGFERNPFNLDPRVARVSCGVHRLETEIMIVLDIDRVLDVKAQAA